MPPLEPDGFISISRIPRLNQGSQDGDTNQQQFPGGMPNPNNPNDLDDDDWPPGRGPPRGPSRGPPRRPPGGPPDNNNPWIPHMPNGPHGAPGGGGGPPGRGPPGRGPPGGPFPQNPPPNQQPANAQGANDSFKFKKKIKISNIPQWDGNSNTILDWLDQLNHIAYHNANVYYDLGLIAPLRLTDTAKQWFYTLTLPQQRYTQQSWGEFKLAISTFFMNQQWFDRMKAHILHMRYHQKGHKQEMPIDYFHCKLRMIQEVFVQTQSETIMEIMNGVPKYWSILINTSRINTLSNLQYHIKIHQVTR